MICEIDGIEYPMGVEIDTEVKGLEVICNLL